MSESSIRTCSCLDLDLDLVHSGSRLVSAVVPEFGWWGEDHAFTPEAEAHSLNAGDPQGHLQMCPRGALTLFKKQFHSEFWVMVSERSKVSRSNWEKLVSADAVTLSRNHKIRLVT